MIYKCVFFLTKILAFSSQPGPLTIQEGGGKGLSRGGGEGLVNKGGGGLSRGGEGLVKRGGGGLSQIQKNGTGSDPAETILILITTTKTKTCEIW